MIEEEAFLCAIIENLGDAAPRLIYADWLEEHDRPAQAELIRVQCALARLPADDPDRPELLEREQELLAEQAAVLRPLCGPGGSWEFQCGFVARLAVAVHTFLEHADELCRVLPLATLELYGRVEGEGGDEELQALAALPRLDRVAYLDLGGNVVTIEGVRALAASPHTGRLTTLVLQRNLLGEEGARALALSRNLGQLVALHLGNNMLGDEGVSALAASPYLPSLAALDLEHNSISDAGLAVLAGSPLLGRLTTLSLRGNLLTDVGARALVRSPHLTRLTGLDLGHNFIGDAGVASLARCRALAGLAGLDLSDNPFSRTGQHAWADSPYIAHLLPGHRRPS